MTKRNPNARPLAPHLEAVRPIRKFWMSPALHVAIAEYAKANRTTISELVREALVDVQRDPRDESVMTAYDEPSSSNSVSAAVDDELYFGAKDAAYPTRKSLTSLVRRRLLLRLERDGAWKAA